MKIEKIHILGASGSGTSTLGKMIEQNYGFKQLDTDDYYWLPTDPPFIDPRERSERIHLLKEDISRNKYCVISGSLCGWGDVLIPYFDLVIRVITPTDIRIERLRKREFGRFGNRVLLGGDMYQEHEKFIKWAAEYDIGSIEMRSKALHEEWLRKISCIKIDIDGTNIAGEISKIEKYFNE